MMDDLILQMVDDLSLEAEIGRRSMTEFIKMSWHLVEPSTQYIHNWHIDAKAEHLDAVLKGQIKTLVISEPPGCMKSLSCSVFFPAWAWIEYPQAKFIHTSFSEANLSRDAKRVRNIFDSKFFKERWGESFNPRMDSWNINRFDNDKGGFRYFTTVQGQVTGEHGHIHVHDDPVKAAEGAVVESKALYDCIEWYNGTMSTRWASGFLNATILIMQRLNEIDLAGYVLDNAEDVVHLMLPMEFERLRS